MLVGPSGCGKTTAMRMVNRTVEITAGDITDRRHARSATATPAQLRREIGYVIQQIGLFPHRTIAENIATVPGAARLGRGAHAGAGRRAARADRPRPRARRPLPGQLSGGQQQRVGVARALAADPPVMLMDEPFGAIDPINRERLQNEFLRLQAEIRKTILFVTHDIDEAIKMGDRIAVMREGGELAQFATPAELLMAPADEFVEDFVGADRALKRLALMRVARHRPLEGAARLRRPGHRRGPGEARGRRGPPRPARRLRAAGRWAGSRSRDLEPARPSRSAPTPSADPMLDATTSCATRSRTCSQAGSQYAPVVDASGRIDGRALGRDHLGLPRPRPRRGRGAPGRRAAAGLALMPAAAASLPLLAQAVEDFFRDR